MHVTASLAAGTPRTHASERPSSFLARCPQQSCGIHEPPKRVTGLAPWQARRAQDFIIAHVEAKPSVTRIAAECRLSPSHFTRAFKATTGLSPHQWLIRQRLLRAKQLMQSGGMRLAEIACACGFADQSHFARCFNAVERQSPAKWRQAHGGPDAQRRAASGTAPSVSSPA